MNLLIITQKVDRKDLALGFFHRWLEVAAQHVDQLTVIAQAVGDYQLPDNVRVVSLGKERGIPKALQLVWFWFLLIRFLKKSDRVLVHMVPLWVVVGIPLYIFFRIPVFLFYIHPRKRGLLYGVARRFCRKIFTAVVASDGAFVEEKVLAVGHGIDVEHFIPGIAKITHSSKQRIIVVGRITTIKKCLEILHVFDYLVNELHYTAVTLDFIGDTVMSGDEEYKKKLLNVIRFKNLGSIVHFIGFIDFRRMPEVYNASDLLINFTPTGSFDKAVLEAMSCNVPVLVSNSLFQSIIPPENFISDINDREVVALQLKRLLENLSSFDFRKPIEESHNLYILIPRLVEEMRAIV